MGLVKISSIYLPTYSIRNVNPPPRRNRQRRVGEACELARRERKGAKKSQVIAVASESWKKIRVDACLGGTNGPAVMWLIYAKVSSFDKNGRSSICSTLIKAATGVAPRVDGGMTKSTMVGMRTGNIDSPLATPAHAPGLGESVRRKVLSRGSAFVPADFLGGLTLCNLTECATDFRRSLWHHRRPQVGHRL